MKKLLAYTLLPAFLLLAGCIKDDRNNNMVPDTLTLTAASEVQDVSVHAGSYVFGVSKSGKGFSAARATVSSSGVAELLQAYNAKRKELDVAFEGFEALPATAFTVEGGNLSWDKSDFVRDVKVSWDPAALSEVIGDRENCVIALALASDDLDVNKEKNLMLIHLTRSSFSLQQTSFSRVIEASKVEAGADGTQPELRENFIFDVKMTHEIKDVGVTLPVVIDNSLIAAFNETQEDTYVAAPEGLFTLTETSVSIGEGLRDATFRGILDKSKLLVDGKLQEFPSYVIPVRVDKDGMSATRKGESFNLQGLSYGNMEAYITVTYKASHTGVLSITREWGRYSTAGAAWNEYYGGAPNTDRNVAMDNEYIYVAETVLNDTDPSTGSKNIWAISIYDATQVKKLPVGTVERAGTFSVCCPRVIPNTDSEVNGGKDVLVVSNMNSGDPILYFYVNGINQDPKAVKCNTWASRRLGDTWTYAGTLQDGILFFKDQSSAQGTVTFPLKYKEATTALNLVRRLEAPTVMGAGAYFPFPDNMYKGICSIRGGLNPVTFEDYMSQLVTVPEGEEFGSGTGGITPTLTPLSGYYQDAAFKFFEYSGKRYVAYTRQVGAADGRLFILEGELTDSWEKILTGYQDAQGKRSNIVYQAAIQEEAELQDDYNPSARESGHSGMDIDCRLINGDMYIVVVKQNVGLSLFRMTK